jgi:hypothetical protein
LGFEEAMACVTPQSLFYMLFMIERDGLFGLGAKTEADEEEQQKNPDGQSKEDGFQFSDPSGYYFTPPYFL